MNLLFQRKEDLLKLKFPISADSLCVNFHHSCPALLWCDFIEKFCIFKAQITLPCFALQRGTANINNKNLATPFFAKILEEKLNDTLYI